MGLLSRLLRWFSGTAEETPKAPWLVDRVGNCVTDKERRQVVLRGRNGAR
jgi:hypothetical protein